MNGKPKIVEGNGKSFFKKKLAGLQINIETVNENYSGGGGENAAKVVTKADLDAEEKEIA